MLIMKRKKGSEAREPTDYLAVIFLVFLVIYVTGRLLGWF
tara:strand:- start:267 stop:386 length:120 start_codon:yes stop_codon:yes gene_type:complete